MAEPALVARVRATIVAHRLLARGARIVVGVSGGADSIALLRILAHLKTEWRLHLHVAHLDHQLRPESARDATFVRELAGRWQISVTVEALEVAARCAREGWSLEDGARRIRYEFLAAVAQRVSAGHLALAHTADDQAETVLMRLIRGAGLTGLGAIPFMRPLGEAVVVRPLLECWRSEIRAYLSAEQLTWCEDPTNADPRFLRNRIRRQLLPLLEQEYNPNIKQRLAQLAEQSRGDAAYLQAAADRVWKRTAKVSPARQVRLAVATFQRQPRALQRQLVRQAIQQVRGDLQQFEFRHWLEVARLFAERPVGTRVSLPGGVELRREQDHVICERVPKASFLSL